MTVIDEISAERQRQVDQEGWSAEHDDGHINGSIARAAGCYSLGADGSVDWKLIEALWPWDPEWFKPKDRRRDLVRAGALIVAEIERLDRQSRQTGC